MILVQDNDKYKSAIKSQITNWQKHLSKYKDVDWLVVHVMYQESSKSGKSKIQLPRSSVYDKLKSDFGHDRYLSGPLDRMLIFFEFFFFLRSFCLFIQNIFIKINCYIILHIAGVYNSGNQTRRIFLPNQVNLGKSYFTNWDPCCWNRLVVIWINLRRKFDLCERNTEILIGPLLIIF